MRKNKNVRETVLSAWRNLSIFALMTKIMVTKKLGLPTKTTFLLKFNVGLALFLVLAS